MGASANKIVELSSVTNRGDGLVCETCGCPKLTDVFCRACAFQLVDEALMSDSKNLAVLGAGIDEYPNPPPNIIQFRYGHYEVCRSADSMPWELGRGAMGITYKATDTHLNCPVALKIINTRRLGGVKARDRFLHEARTAAHLRHANIASIFHLGLGEENCFYAMEYIEGETLEARVTREGSMPPRLALSIIAQSARALQLAHSLNFIHRDIKPTNIMLVDGRHHLDGGVLVKLIDFGLVKAVADQNSHDLVIESYFAGTPHYASSEQLEGKAVDARSDIYSLGRCLGFMLSGTAATEAPGDVTPEVVALLEAMVSKDPEARPQNAADLLVRIAECEAGIAALDGSIRELPTDPSHKRNKILRHAVVLPISALIAAIFIVTAYLGVKHLANGAEANPSSVSAESMALFAQATEHYRKYDKENNEQAITLYSKAAALSPAYAEASAMLASAYFDRVCRYGAPKEQLDLATAAANRAIAADAKAAKAYQVLGAIRNFQGEPWEALVQVHRALELDPNSVLAMCDFSLLWICVGEPHLALPWAKEASRLEPSKVQSWHAAAEASVELCADEQAESFYWRCITLKPTWMSGYCGLTHLHLLQGNFAQARLDWMKAESIQPGLLLPLTLKAQIALFSGDYADAEICYRQLLAKNRVGLTRYYSGISYLSALGYLRLRVGDMAGAQVLLDEAATLHLDTEGPEDVYDLAAIRAIEGRRDDALSLLEQAVASGWNDFRATRLDPRFSALREEPRFLELLAHLDKHVAQMREIATELCAKPFNLSDYPVTQPAGGKLAHAKTVDK